LYSDTDSLILNNPDLSAFGKGFINSYMGGGKIEATGDTFALLQPKNYIIYKKNKPVKEALSIIKGESNRMEVKKMLPKDFILLKSFKVNSSWEVKEMTNQHVIVKQLDKKQDLYIQGYDGNVVLTTEGKIKYGGTDTNKKKGRK
jgi:hypothetical protein